MLELMKEVLRRGGTMNISVSDLMPAINFTGSIPAVELRRTHFDAEQIFPAYQFAFCISFFDDFDSATNYLAEKITRELCSACPLERYSKCF